MLKEQVAKELYFEGEEFEDGTIAMETWVNGNPKRLEPFYKRAERIINLFKAEVDKLIVIGVMEMPPILEKINLPHKIPNTAENYDYLWTEREVLVKAQCEADKKQLLDLMVK